MDIKTPLQRVQITRADYELRFGLRPDEYSVGAIIVNEAGIPVIEYLFLTAAQEIALLSWMYNRE